jgi:hypothetical protein
MGLIICVGVALVVAAVLRVWQVGRRVSRGDWR